MRWGSAISVASVILIVLPPLLLAANDSEPFIQSNEPPIIPIGLDAYSMWDRLPYHRIGVRAYMRSTYDREGDNRAADASHFLYQESDAFNVALDIKSPGILYFKRTNHFHGSPWHYEIDGRDFIVKETATDDPIDAKKKYRETTFIPERLFPNPLTWTWSITKGADMMWVPLPFEKSFRIAYSRTFYGTGYYIYHLLSPGMKNLSRPLQSWRQTPPDGNVLTLLNRSGTDIAPKGGGVEALAGEAALQPHQWTAVCGINNAPASVRALKFTVPRELALDFGKCRLRVTWDRRWHASIDAPVALFFGAGELYNNNNRKFLVKGFLMGVHYDDQNAYLYCYYPMPFFQHAQFEIQNRSGKTLNGIQWEIRTEPYSNPVNHAAYFHATYTDHPHPTPGQDNVFLDTSNVEGGGEWSGNFVGMSWIFSRTGTLNTLEGDPRFFFDGSKTPQGWGTGTEEWGGGGDYWGGENMTIPFAGHPLGCQKEKIKTDKDLLNSAYRFLIADMFPFGNRAVIQLEHGAVNNSREHYSGVVYWYGVDSPALVLTDELNVCDEKSIKAHAYDSPGADRPYILVSRYEWGPDSWRDEKNTPGGMQFFPAEEDQVRVMKGESQFTVNLDPANLGVLLRRKFDYVYPNQSAKVWIRPSSSPGAWRYVGEWYTAGSNTCVFSRPGGRNFSDAELKPAEHHIITSNRRWREEEFLIPRELTEGKRNITIKIEHVPIERELFPGQKYPEESVWSESRYWIYCYKMPSIRLNNDSNH